MRFFGVSANRSLNLDREGMPIKDLRRGGRMDDEKQPRLVRLCITTASVSNLLSYSQPFYIRVMTRLFRIRQIQ